MLYISTAIENTDNFNGLLIFINKVIDGVIVHRKEAHSH